MGLSYTYSILATGSNHHPSDTTHLFKALTIAVIQNGVMRRGANRLYQVEEKLVDDDQFPISLAIAIEYGQPIHKTAHELLRI